MRQIGTLPGNLDAKVLEDYLLSQGIKARFDPSVEGRLVWVYNEDDVARAGAELRAFIDDPAASRFTQAASAAEEVRRQQSRLDREFRKNFRDVTDQWSGLLLRRRPVTLALVFVAVMVFVLEQAFPGARAGQEPLGYRVLNALLISPVHIDPEHGRLDAGLQPILEGQVWRLVTPIFLHFSLMHILFNCWAILVEGTIIETRRGSLRLGILVLVSAIASNLGQYFYMDQANPGGLHLFGGLSGVCYALFGYLWMKGQYEPEQGMILHPNTITTMLFWLVLCMTGAVGAIANAAHVVGLLVGIAFGVMRL